MKQGHPSVPAILILAFLAAMACCRISPSLAQPAASPIQILEQLPESLARFQRGRPPVGSGENASVMYRADRIAAIATIYVYTRGPDRLTEGAESPAVAREIMEGGRAIVQMGPAQRLTTVRQNRDLVLSSNGRPLLRCEAYTQTVAESGDLADSFICVGVLNARFLKLRLTMRRSPVEGAADAVLSVLSHAILGSMTGGPLPAWRLSSAALPSG